VAADFGIAVAVTIGAAALTTFTSYKLSLLRKNEEADGQAGPEASAIGADAALREVAESVVSNECASKKLLPSERATRESDPAARDAVLEWVQKTRRATLEQERRIVVAPGDGEWIGGGVAINAAINARGLDPARLQVARSCWAPLEKDSYWAQMMRTFDGCLTTTLAYTWNIFISDLIFYPILHAFPELQSSLEYCLLEIGRAIVFFVPAALLYARSHSKVKPTDASEPATFRHRLHVHLVEAAISLAGAALAAAMYDFCTIWLAEKTSTGGGIGLAFAMYAFLCVIALAAARRFGWGPSFFRREIDTTTA